MNVAVVGASNKPHRYSYKAMQLLLEKGHTPIPVHPILKEIEGVGVYSNLAEIPEPLDTITLYVSSEKSSGMEKEILGTGCRRVIFNPGAENPPLAESLRADGVDTIEACTLVLLRTGGF